MFYLLDQFAESISEMDMGEGEHVVCNIRHKSTFDLTALTKILRNFAKRVMSCSASHCLLLLQRPPKLVHTKHKRKKC